MIIILESTKVILKARGREELMVVILFHTSYNGWLIFLFPTTIFCSPHLSKGKTALRKLF